MVLSAILLFGSTAVMGTAATGSTASDGGISLELSEPPSISQPPAVPAELLPPEDFEMMAEHLGISVEDARTIGVFTDYAGSLESEYLRAYPDDFAGIVIDPILQTMTLHAKAELVEELSGLEYDYPVTFAESQYSALELEVGATELARELAAAGFSADVTGDIATSTVEVTTNSADVSEVEKFLRDSSAVGALATTHAQHLLDDGAVQVTDGVVSKPAFTAQGGN